LFDGGSEPLRRHYVALDGLRGIAALAVLLFHQLGVFGYGSITAPLAVDFFFMLSGFVLAYAYAEPDWLPFMRLRLIRLYPMLLLGICMGGLVSLRWPAPHENPITFIATLLMLPVGLLWGVTSFLFNGILWSLFFEFAISAAYPFMRRWWWLAPAILALVVFGIWAGSIADLGRKGLINFIGGFPRVVVPFAMGAAIYRLEIYKRFPKVPFALPVIGLSVLLLIPMRPWWPYDLACLFVAFPLLIGLGAESDGGSFCKWLGRISYPVYCVHWPLSVFASHALRGLYPPLAIAISMSVSILFAWAAVRYYDEPVRLWLGRLNLDHASAVRPVSREVRNDRSTAEGGAAVDPR